MKLILIILFSFFTLGLSAQDSLKFEFSDSVFIVGQEKRMEFRYEYCFPLGSKGGNLLELDSIQKFLIGNGSIKISIIQHTDTRGSTNANQNLSDRRAEAIKTELVSRGISENRIESIGKGESEPIHSEEEINQYKQTDSDKYEQLHQINRRTIIRIIHI